MRHPTTIQARDDHLVGDTTDDHGEAHHGQGEHVAAHDGGGMGQRMGPYR